MDEHTRAGAPPAILPISILPGVESAVPHAHWRAARRAILEALLGFPSCVVVTGASGAGKTLLLEDLARTLFAQGDARVRFLWGEAAVLEMLDAPQFAAVRILLIDGGDHVTDATLTRLVADFPGGAVVARVGAPAPAIVAAAVGSGRRLTVVPLPALPNEEVGPFIAARLAQAQWPPEFFDERSIARIAACSGGLPRHVNMLASAAMFFAGGRPADRVSERHVDHAAEFLGLPLLREAAPEPAPEPVPSSIDPLSETGLEPVLTVREGPLPRSQPRRASPRTVERQTPRRRRVDLRIAAALALAVCGAAAGIAHLAIGGVQSSKVASTIPGTVLAAATAATPPAATSPMLLASAAPSAPDLLAPVAAPAAAPVAPDFLPASDGDPRVLAPVPANDRIAARRPETTIAGLGDAIRRPRLAVHRAPLFAPLPPRYVAEPGATPFGTMGSAAPAVMAQPVAFRPASPVATLLRARAALSAGDDAAARDLLEAAVTSFAFRAGPDTAQSARAAAHLTRALSALNTVGPQSAAPELDRALVVIDSRP